MVMVNGSVTYGTDFNKLDPMRLQFANGVAYPPTQLWSGIWRDQVASELSFDDMITWRISRPYPAFIVAAGGFMSKSDS